MNRWIAFGLILLLVGLGCTQLAVPPEDTSVPDRQRAALDLAHQSRDGAFMLKKQQALAAVTQCDEAEYSEALARVQPLLGANGFSPDTTRAEEAYALGQQCGLSIEERVEQAGNVYSVHYDMRVSPSCPSENVRMALTVDDLFQIDVQNDFVVVSQEIEDEGRVFYDSLMDASGPCFAPIFLFTNIEDIESVDVSPSDALGESEEAILARSAIDRATQAVIDAASEGRTEGLATAQEQLEAARQAHDNGDYTGALQQAEEAEEWALSATVPPATDSDVPSSPANEDAQAAYDALVVAYNSLLAAHAEGRTEGWTEANATYNEALLQYDAGNYAQAISQAQQAETLSAAATAPPPPAVAEPLNRSSAITILVQNVIQQYDHPDGVEAYGYPQLLSPADRYTVIVNGVAADISVENDGWLFWVDEAPDARFEHAVDVVFIEAADGSIAISESGWWPYINGELMDNEPYADWNAYAVYYREDGVAVPRAAPAAAAARVALPPAFGACGADPAERKRAVVVYALATDADSNIQADAVNMYNALCVNNYVTTVVTSNESATLEAQITTAVEEVATASRQPDGSLNSFVFYTVTHGQRGTGNLVINTRGASHEVLPIADVAAVLGAEAFHATIWSDSFSVIQDSCYSGYAIDAYPPQADENSGDVGWVFSSQTRTQQGWGDPNKNQTSVFTNALVECMRPLILADELEACIQPKMNAALSTWAHLGYNQTTLHAPLTAITSPVVPVFTQ